MGSLAVSLGIPAPFGSIAFLGAMFVGGLLFPPDDVESFGPRTSEFKFSSSTRGKGIPEGFGTIVLPGEVFWMGEIREIENVTETSGGKGGGPTARNTQYEYRVNWSAAFAQGPAEEITRIWLDEHLVYDNRDPATSNAQTGVILQPGLTLRKYFGTENQLACPVIQAEEGVAEVSAYRGTVYVTWDNMDITKYGRPPQIKAEVCFKCTPAVDSQTPSIDTGSPWNDSTDNVYADWTRNRLLQMDDGNDGNPSGETSGWRVFDPDTMVQYQNIPNNDVGSPFVGADLNVNTFEGMGRWTNFLFVQHPGGNQAQLNFINPETMRNDGSFGTSGSLPGLGSHGLPGSISSSAPWTDCVILAPAIPGVEATEQRIAFAWSAIVSAFVMVDFTVSSNPIILCWGGAASGEFISPVGAMALSPRVFDNRIYTLYHTGGTANAYLKYYGIDYGSYYDAEANACRGLSINDVTTFSASLWNNDATAGSLGGPLFDETDGQLIFWAFDQTDKFFIWKYNWELNEIVWNKGPYTSGNFKPVNSRYIQGSVIRNGEIGFISSSNYIVIDTLTGEIVTTGSSTSGRWLSTEYVWNDQTRCFYGHASDVFGNALERKCVGRPIPQGESWESIINTLSGDGVNGAKLEPAQYNASALSSDILRGGAIMSQGTARPFIESGGAAFEFDSVQVDGVVTWVKRGGGLSATIPEDDLVDQRPLVKETRTLETELPRRLKVSFMDIDADYEDNASTAQRPSNPIATMLSRSEGSAEFPFVFTMSEGKVIAERLLHTAWVQRITFEIILSKKYLQLVPTNEIRIAMNDGDNFDLRIVEIEDMPDTTRVAKCTLLDSQLQATSVATADPLLGFEPQQVANSAITKTFLIDGPYLRDNDAVQRGAIELKYGMAGQQAGWTSGTFYKSLTGSQYVDVGRSQAATPHGIITNKLPAGANLDLTDKTTVLEVVMTEGTLSSVSDLDYYNGVNIAAVGDRNTGKFEYIIFRDAVQQAGQTYHVSYIGRGRRGTDNPFHTESHNDAETFVLLDTAWINRILLPLSEFNTTINYKGVGDSEVLDSVSPRILASSGGPLKPFRPVYFTAAVDGSDNIDLGWERSTRLNFDNPLDWGNKSLEEDTEEYDLEILDAIGGNILRTVNGLTSKAYEWTKANIIADYGIGTGVTTLDVGSTSTFTQASGDFGLDGFVAGQIIESVGFTDGANNGQFTVSVVAALTLTIEETTLVVESGGGDEQIDMIRDQFTYIRGYQKSAQVGRGYASFDTQLVL